MSSYTLISMEAMREKLGCIGRTKAHELIHSGEIASVKLGASRKPVLESVDAYIERLMEEAAV